MWPGGTPHVVVGTLKISLDRLITPQVERKKKSNYSNVEKSHKSACVSPMLYHFFFQA